MPVALAIGGAALIGGVATMSASSKAASASQKATDATTVNNRESIAAQERIAQENIDATRANQEAATIATRENTDKAVGRVNEVQDKAQSDISGYQADTRQVAGQTRDANTGIWQNYLKQLDPYLDAGSKAVSNLSDPGASFTTSPDYNFRLSQGENAVTTNKAVSGLLKSGSALKAVNNYAQDTAKNEFAAWWARQQGLVGTGQTAINQSQPGYSGIATANTNYDRTIGSINDTLSNEAGSSATARGNAAVGAGTANTNVATGTAAALNAAGSNAMMQSDAAIRSATSSNNEAIGSNAVNQGNAGLVQSNAIGSTVGSISDLIAKYATNSNGSSYAAANTNDGFGTGYAGTGLYSQGNFIG